MAVKVKGNQWGRGRLIGEKLFKCHDGLVASIFMVDSGKVMEGVKVVDSVRIIPKHFENPDADESEQAVNVVVSGSQKGQLTDSQSHGN